MAKTEKSSKKRVVKVDAIGKAFVNASFNNIIITLTNNAGQVISWASAGKMGSLNFLAILDLGPMYLAILFVYVF